MVEEEKRKKSQKEERTPGDPRAKIEEFLHSSIFILNRF